MDKTEAALIWTATALYALSAVAALIVAVFHKERPTKAAIGIAVGGAAFHFASLAYRTVVSGHIPVEGIYENAATGALFIAVPAAVIAVRSKRYRLPALAAVPLALFLLGYGLMHYRQGTPLPPPYRSTWLVIHVIFAQLAYGAYTLAMAVAIILLWKERNERRGTGNGVLDRLPPASELDDTIFRFVVFGFVTSAMMIIAGAFWADALWGNYWSWDPVETWSLISWLIYGAFIHLRVIHKWKGRRLAWLAIFAMIAVVISYYGAEYFSSRTHLLNQE